MTLILISCKLSYILFLCAMDSLLYFFAKMKLDHSYSFQFIYKHYHFLQLAALDYIGCTASDAFAMTDSGSQLSSLVSGYRIYYGGGKMPTIRPNKRRLAAIFTKNSTIGWHVFEQRVRKAVRQTKQVLTRPKARSIYRYPRCEECMCQI